MSREALGLAARRVVWSLRRPLTTGVGETRRRVLQLRLQAEDREGRGEAAPLPGLHAESLADVEESLGRLASRWGERAPGQTPREWARQAGLPLPPSLEWALDTAWREAAGEGVAEVAPPSAGLLDAPPGRWADELAARPPRAVWKVKLGRHEPAEEAAALVGLARRFPAAAWRLDANRAFSLAGALAFQHAARPFTPQWIEEPLADPGELLAWRRQGGWPYALDESLREPLAADLAEGAAAWVLKPSWLGPAEVERWFARARSLAHRDGHAPACVVSSCFETPLGLAALGRLAARAPGRPAPGLGTDEWLGSCLEEEAWRPLA